MRVAFAILLSLCSLGVALGVPRNRVQEELDICEAILGYMVDFQAPGQQRKPEGFYIAISRRVNGTDKENAFTQSSDPDEAFMRRFAGHIPPVKKRSEAIYNEAVYDAIAAERAVIGEMSRLKWFPDSEGGGGLLMGPVASDKMGLLFPAYPPALKPHFEVKDGVWNAVTGDRGVACDVSWMQWLSDSEVNALGGYFHTSRSFAYAAFRLRKMKGKWKVVGEFPMLVGGQVNNPDLSRYLTNWKNGDRKECFPH